jgi:hypothetical protein
MTRNIVNQYDQISTLNTYMYVKADKKQQPVIDTIQG